VTNINVTVVHNTYNETVVNNVTVNRVSYNGGAGGITATPTAQERIAAQEQHVTPTQAQRLHVQQAAANPALLAKNNGGHPSIAATPHPGAFNAPGVVGAHGAPAAYNNHNGGAAGHGTAGPQAYGKPPAPKANAKPHPKAPPKEEEKTAQR
jgi:hypothetical protein